MRGSSSPAASSERNCSIKISRTHSLFIFRAHIHGGWCGRPFRCLGVQVCVHMLPLLPLFTPAAQPTSAWFIIEHPAEGMHGCHGSFGWGPLLERAQGVHDFCRTGSFTYTHQLSTSQEIWTGSLETWVTEFRWAKLESCQLYRFPVISYPTLYIVILDWLLNWLCWGRKYTIYFFSRMACVHHILKEELARKPRYSHQCSFKCYISTSTTTPILELL